MFSNSAKMFLKSPSHSQVSSVSFFQIKCEPCDERLIQFFPLGTPSDKDPAVGVKSHLSGSSARYREANRQEINILHQRIHEADLRTIDAERAARDQAVAARDQAVARAEAERAGREAERAGREVEHEFRQFLMSQLSVQGVQVNLQPRQQ